MKKRIRVVLFVSLSFVQILIAMFIVVKKWLRTAFETDAAVVKTIEDGMFSGNGVVYPAYVRPAFTLPPETEVEEKEIDGRKTYIHS